MSTGSLCTPTTRVCLLRAFAAAFAVRQVCSGNEVLCEDVVGSASISTAKQHGKTARQSGTASDSASSMCLMCVIATTVFAVQRFDAARFSTIHFRKPPISVDESPSPGCTSCCMVYLRTLDDVLLSHYLLRKSTMGSVLLFVIHLRRSLFRPKC